MVRWMGEEMREWDEGVRGWDGIKVRREGERSEEWGGEMGGRDGERVNNEWMVCQSSSVTWAPAGCSGLATSFISCSFHCDKSERLQFQVRVHSLEVSLIDKAAVIWRRGAHMTASGWVSQWEKEIMRLSSSLTRWFVSDRSDEEPSAICPLLWANQTFTYSSE